MKKKDDKRNGSISLWKFIFSIVIVIYHTATFYNGERIPLFSYGYIAVEFFFIVSGYYLAKSCLNNKKSTKEIGKETFGYIIKKLKSFYPYILIGYIIALPILKFCAGFTISQLCDSIWSFLLLRGIGMGRLWLFGPLWYLSAMIVSIMVLYPLLRKYKENYVYIFSVLFSILGLVYMYKHGSLNMARDSWDGYICMGISRAFIEMNMGCLIYLLCEKFKKINLTNFSKILLTIIAQGFLISILVVTSVIERAGLYQFIMLLMIAISVFIMMSEITYERKMLSNRFVYYLEQLSLVIFILHNVVLHFVKYSTLFNNWTPHEKSILSVIITILASVIIELLVRYLKKKEISKKISKLFIK